MTNFRKILTIGLAVATLGLGVVATSSPAAAWGRYHHRNYWGWGLGGVAAGLALGAAAAAAPYYGYSYASCGIVREPVVDVYGNIIRYRRVRVCD